MKLNELKMLERVRGGLDTDANLSGQEKQITHNLYLGGYIGAAPVEGSDAAQDGLWITVKGLIALGAPRIEVLEAVGFLEAQKSIFEDAMTAFPEDMTKLLKQGTDLSIMRADLLAREIEKNTPPPEPDYTYTLHFPKAEE
jgi:hypothetical protein